MKSEKMCKQCGRQHCACEGMKCGGAVKKYKCGGMHKAPGMKKEKKRG